MGFTDFIIKLSNTKFARKFQYEPYIIKSVEYINPLKDDSLLVIYKDTDYLQSLMQQYIKRENYISYEVGQEIELDRDFNKTVLFFSINDISKKQIDTISSHMLKDSRLFSIFYLNSSKFFEWTLRLTDRDIFKKLQTGNDGVFNDKFMFMEKLELPKQYISVSKYKVVK